ncbi:hypothetical protein J6590_016471 [Homalodisca vitripennis]|nr:hypothetical protein J6590_016471 [Homalodisca vitripennis]
MPAPRNVLRLGIESLVEMSVTGVALGSQVNLRNRSSLLVIRRLKTYFQLSLLRNAEPAFYGERLLFDLHPLLISVIFNSFYAEYTQQVGSYWLPQWSYVAVTIHELIAEGNCPVRAHLVG